MSKKPESGGLFFDGIVDGGDLSNPAVSRFVPFRQTIGPVVDPSRHQEISDLIASIQPRDAESLQPEKPAVPKRTRNHKRDAWIYDQAMKGVPWNTINNGIPKRFPEYDSFADHSGVIRAAKRWAEKNGKPLPPLRR